MELSWLAVAYLAGVMTPLLFLGFTSSGFTRDGSSFLIYIILVMLFIWMGTFAYLAITAA